MQIYQMQAMSVLLVEPNRMDAARLQQILANRVKLVMRETVAEAIEYLAGRTVDVVVTTAHGTGADGFELLRRMRESADERTQHTPVIMTTKDQTQKAEAAIIMAGAFGIIHKPFIPIIVVKRIEQVLELEYLHSHLKTEVSRQTRLAESRLESSRRLFDEMVLALAKTVDAKDAYTNGHSQRVADYAELIAGRLGWPAEEQKKIYQMGLLHDIGKIGVPEAIINKPDKLTDEEYATIKQHTVIGAEILQLVEEFPELTIGARYHHERYDGRGYPEGLEGEDIPVYARVIAVADSYDAMSSKRSYRDVLPQDVVRGEIVKGRGSQFDPDVADVMLQIIDEDVEYVLHE